MGWLYLINFDPKLLAREGHGAIEVDLPEKEPLIVIIAGPISYWWRSDEIWDSKEHKIYVQWRDAVRVACVKAGFLIYAPYRAFQGAWSERAQAGNDFIISTVVDVMLDLTPLYWTAEMVPGTTRERQVAEEAGTKVIDLPPGTKKELKTAIDELASLC